MFTSFLRPKVTLGYCLLTLFVATPAWADDIEIYSNVSEGGSANIVFIIDTSGSMDDSVDGSQKNLPDTDTRQRLYTVKDKFSGIVDEIATMNTKKNITMNAAVMRFNGSEGGYFIAPMQTVTDANKQASFKDKVNALSPSGNTPLSETLYEAARYYRGENESYGIDLNDTGVLVTPTTGSDADQYQSPIAAPDPDSQCGVSNHIVLLTDGSPKSDTGANTAINEWINPTTSCDTNDNCLDELAGFLHDTPQKLDQVVTTHTIAFGTGGTMDLDLLKATASTGQGIYRSAANSMELATAFKDILKSINMSTKPDSMAAPALTVDTFNRLTHSEEVYFSLYNPATKKTWPGNIKGFKLGTDPDDASRVTLLDANGDRAIDNDNGEISATAKSLWSSVVDGKYVTKGGAASKLPLNSVRNVYTYTGAVSGDVVAVDKTLSTYPLPKTSSTEIDKLLFPPSGTVPTGVDTDELLNWARGDDLNGGERLSMGDPLHSQPVVVSYGSTSANPESVLYVATNEGFLHAIDTENGVEKFAFMPQALLKNLHKMKSNTADEDHIYGLDGNITTWIVDKNGNGLIDDGTDEVYLVVGMRRGGQNYYMLDVSKPDAPKLKWIIQGGIADTDYEELGQTWSRPTLGKLRIGSKDEQVLVFGGGYDPKEDLDPPQADTIGGAIFIVNALDGSLLWSAGSENTTEILTTMTHSIPSDVRVLDVDLDGYIDRLYVGDMGGQIFRVDLDNDAESTATSVSATIGRIAKLGGTGTSDRRFYNAPDVVLTKNPNLTQAYLSINIGSGYRAHPTDTGVNDYFYSIRDTDVFDKPATYEYVDEDDLYNATLNLVGEGADIEDEKIILNGKSGWYIKLGGSGEKVLAEALTYDNKIFFSTYTPAVIDPNDTTCANNSLGTGKLYAVSLFDATPIRSDDTAYTKEDRLIKELDKGGIPLPPVVAFPPGKKPTLLVGNESFNGTIGLELLIQKSYWIQE